MRFGRIWREFDEPGWGCSDISTKMFPQIRNERAARFNFRSKHEVWSINCLSIYVFLSTQKCLERGAGYVFSQPARLWEITAGAFFLSPRSLTRPLHRMAVLLHSLYLKKLTSNQEKYTQTPTFPKFRDVKNESPPIVPKIRKISTNNSRLKRERVYISKTCKLVEPNLEVRVEDS